MGRAGRVGRCGLWEGGGRIDPMCHPLQVHTLCGIINGEGNIIVSTQE